MPTSSVVAPVESRLQCMLGFIGAHEALAGIPVLHSIAGVEGRLGFLAQYSYQRARIV